MRAKRTFEPSSSASFSAGFVLHVGNQHVAAQAGEMSSARGAQSRAAAGDESRAACDFHGGLPSEERSAVRNAGPDHAAGHFTLPHKLRRAAAARQLAGAGSMSMTCTRWPSARFVSGARMTRSFSLSPSTISACSSLLSPTLTACNVRATVAHGEHPPVVLGPAKQGRPRNDQRVAGLGGEDPHPHSIVDAQVDGFPAADSDLRARIS